VGALWGTVCCVHVHAPSSRLALEQGIFSPNATRILISPGIEKKATGLGTAIGGAPTKPSAKALPSTARRPVAHRSASLPTTTKPGSGVPLGAKKAPGLAAAKKQPGAAVSAAKTTAPRALATPKPYGVSKPYPTSTASLPKPFPTGAANAAPKPYSGAGSKTPVRPGQSKPFAAPKAPAGRSPYPGANTNVSTGSKPYPGTNPNVSTVSKPYPGTNPNVSTVSKPYPGTNTLPGQASNTPVKKYKPAQRYEPPAKAGEVKSYF
jgi:hypothetical protein